MWGTVLLMAVGAGATPARIGAVAFMLTRREPIRLLVSYAVGGFGLSLIVGIVAVFVLKSIDVGKHSPVPPQIEIAVGAFSLVLSVLIGTGVSATLRQRMQSRHPVASPVVGRDGSASSADSSGRTPLPGFDKLPNRVKALLSKDSPWVAWIAGLAVGTPNAYYVAAIAAILKGGFSAPTQVAALVVFNVIAFAQAAVPMISFRVAPEATRSRIEQLYTWVDAHQDLLLTVLTGVVGIYLVVVGVSKL